MDPATKLIEFSSTQWNHYNKLKVLYKKKIQCESHINNLTDYIENDITPKGLKIKVRPNICNERPGFKNNVKRVLHNTERKLMHLIINEQKKAFHTYARKITDTESLMTQQLRHDQIADISEKLDRFTANLTTVRKQRHYQKLKKFKNRCHPSDNINNTTRNSRHYHSRRNNRGKKNKPTPDPKAVINLSTIKLSDSDISVLSKGLSFCPTPKTININELKLDIAEFKRKCRLAYIYRDEDDTTQANEVHRIFPREKSSYIPPASNNQNLERFLNMVEGDILNRYNWNKSWDNLSANERKSFTQLKNREDIVIKPADKGGSIVVMDTTWYATECHKQLQDTQFYEQLPCDPTEQYTDQLQKKINRWKRKGWISNKTASHLLPPEPKPGHFYGLPKVHKKDTPLRPIIPQCQALTNQLATFVDYHLQPIVKSLPSYIQDTNHHLQDIDQVTVPDNALLVTIDGKSLYTNIPQEFSLNAVRDFVTTSNIDNPELLIEMLEFILHHNYFVFHETFYLQKHGTAMGSKVAPSYANLAMGKIEKSILHGHDFKPQRWKRFIDDVRFIWIHGLTKLHNFLQFCNQIHPTIKFTMEYSSLSLPFLDTLMTIQDNQISTSIYSKPTDRHTYLWFTSCHPKHTFKSISWSQTLRYRRICSNETLFDSATKQMKEHFVNRGYNAREIDNKLM
ncbi:uncharacterized protein [Ptychodera flava]|uniref:uncharacterized protein n=1 Tax=Ptychodera flava TaxID=63121 RepID=UPI003969BF4C